MDDNRTAYLIERYLSGAATAEEKDELAQWVAAQQDDVVLSNALERAWEQHQPDKDMAAIAGPALDRIEARLFGRKEPARVITIKHATRKWWRIAAAVLVIVAGAAMYTLLQWNAANRAVMAHDVAPGANRATLTLAGGRTILLDSARDGVLASEGNAKVQKLSGGQLVYEQTGGVSEEMVYNSLSTPRGGQYQLTLPDGTKVWLNAASSITYPTAFTGQTRNVSVTGEVYFEVAANKAMPFSVNVGSETKIDVLGTHFNVNAYKDEQSINTTLLEGAVKINAGHQTRLLAPGQQAQLTRKTGQLQLVAHANVSEAVAWKEGTFAFTDAGLPEVMRQLARWYDLEVEYRGAVPKLTFTGEIDRDLTLSQVLKGLSKLHIRYRLEDGNKLVILP